MKSLRLIQQAIKDLQQGKMIILVDDEDRENEGDLVCAAEKVTPEIINFMAKYARGLICVSLPGERLDALNLPMMVGNNSSHLETSFTISIDLKRGIRGVTTGISTYDRSETIKALTVPTTKPEDFSRPGHIFPLRAKDGGVLVRVGHTEASLDLSKLAGLYPAAVICEILDEDGTMMRLPQLQKFAKKHKLTLLSIAELVEYRRKKETLVKQIAKTTLPTEFGTFDLTLFADIITGHEHVVLSKGKINAKTPTFVRVHSECLTGDTFSSLRCDCGKQLDEALKIISKHGGVVLYLRNQEGRGIGLTNKIKAYELQNQGYDTVEANQKLGFPADLRDYGIGAQILKLLGLRKIRLLTNNPKKIAGIKGYDLDIVEQVPLQVPSTPQNKRYLATKKEKLGHLLHL